MDTFFQSTLAVPLYMTLLVPILSSGWLIFNRARFDLKGWLQVLLGGLRLASGKLTERGKIIWAFFAQQLDQKGLILLLVDLAAGLLFRGLARRPQNAPGSKPCREHRLVIERTAGGTRVEWLMHSRPCGQAEVDADLPPLVDQPMEGVTGIGAAPQRRSGARPRGGRSAGRRPARGDT